MRIAFIAMLVVWLTGCGNKGPLYLPDEAPTIGTPGVEGDTVADERDAEEDDESS
ncbi:MAG: lipoprotein [Pseudomonadota bacterium]